MCTPISVLPTNYQSTIFTYDSHGIQFYLTKITSLSRVVHKSLVETPFCIFTLYVLTLFFTPSQSKWYKTSFHCRCSRCHQAHIASGATCKQNFRTILYSSSSEIRQIAWTWPVLNTFFTIKIFV